MTVEKYYREHYQDHLAGLIKNSNAHEHGEDGLYISFHCLQPKYMNWIPEEEKALFFYCLAFIILIDQVMYTHFRSDYRNFQKSTNYIKCEYGLTSRCPNPWLITELGIGTLGFDIFERVIPVGNEDLSVFCDPGRKQLFVQTCKFFIRKFKNIFTANKFMNASWGAVRGAMVFDRDVHLGKFGQLFIKMLIEDMNDRGL